MDETFWVSYALLWVLVVGLGVIVLALFRELGRIYLSAPDSYHRDGVAVGRRLPNLELTLPQGAASLEQVLSPWPCSMVLATRPDCEFCPGAARAVAHGLEVLPDVAGVVLETELAPSADGELGGLVVAGMGPHGLSHLGVRATPFAFVVARDRTVLAKGIVNDEGHLRELLEQAARSPEGEVIARQLPPRRDPRDPVLNVIHAGSPQPESTSTRRESHATN